MKSAHLASLALTALLAAGSAAAQYKVIGPDGTVTYTDRPPTANTSAKVTPMTRAAAAAQAAAESGLPYELQQVASRYPVTLFAQADCSACDAARNLLQQRGVPYAEKQIVTDEDVLALERLVGGRTVPSAIIGGQALRGLSPSEWDSYLDAAGYPRESKLPRNWQPPKPVPLVARATPTPVATPAPRTARNAAPESPPPPPPAEGGFRF